MTSFLNYQRSGLLVVMDTSNLTSNHFTRQICSKGAGLLVVMETIELLPITTPVKFVLD